MADFLVSLIDDNERLVRHTCAETLIKVYYDLVVGFSFSKKACTYCLSYTLHTHTQMTAEDDIDTVAMLLEILDRPDR
jgi:hypothetical protein